MSEKLNPFAPRHLVASVARHKAVVVTFLENERREWAASLRRTFRGELNRRSGLIMATVVGLTALSTAGYTVKAGDTLAEIARAHGITVGSLVTANQIANPNLIRIGQVLTIPGAEGGPAATYTVVRGDTLAKIAKNMGTTVAALATANNLGNVDLIRIGQKLAVPTTGATTGGGATATTTHLVKAGETLAQIAAKYGVTVDDLKAANGLTGTTIYAGTTLVIATAAPTTVAEGTTEATTHTVKAGETLGGIAAIYGVATTDLAAANALANPNLLKIGQQLVIPGIQPVWVCPVAGARYFNDWGFPRSGGRFHQGNDLFAPRGTPILAPVSGTVEMRTGVIGGLQFLLQGDDAIRYIGSHLDGFGNSGRVKAGDVIGYVGDSGNAIGSSPHLHFEMAKDGTTINPYPTLQANGC